MQATRLAAAPKSAPPTPTLFEWQDVAAFHVNQLPVSVPMGGTATFKGKGNWTYTPIGNAIGIGPFPGDAQSASLRMNYSYHLLALQAYGSYGGPSPERWSNLITDFAAPFGPDNPHFHALYCIDGNDVDVWDGVVAANLSIARGFHAFPSGDYRGYLVFDIVGRNLNATANFVLSDQITFTLRALIGRI